MPALQSTRPDVAGALRSENAGGGEPGQLRWRNALVVAQLAISLVLLVGAGLFLRSFQRVQAVDPGFGREPTALMTFMTPATRFAPPAGSVPSWRSGPTERRPRDKQLRQAHGRAANPRTLRGPGAYPSLSAAQERQEGRQVTLPRTGWER